MLLCVASNGLGIAPYASRLAAIGVSHVTLTVNAVDPQVGQAIYAWVREEPRVYRGLAAAELLLDPPVGGGRRDEDPRPDREDQCDHYPGDQRRPYRGSRAAWPN